MNPTVLHKNCQCFIQFANKQHSTTPVPTWQSSWRACHSWFWTLKGRYLPYSHIFLVLFCLQWNCVERRWRPMEPPTKLARFGLVPGRHRISDFCEQYSNSLFDQSFHQDELMLKDECILVNYMDEALAPFNFQSLGKTEPCFFESRWLVTTTSTTATNSCRVNHVVCCLGLNKMAWNLVRVILFGYRADENWWKNPNAIDATCVTHHWPEKKWFQASSVFCAAFRSREPVAVNSLADIWMTAVRNQLCSCVCSACWGCSREPTARSPFHLFGPTPVWC